MNTTSTKHRKPSVWYAGFALISVLAVIIIPNIFFKLPVSALFLLSWLIAFPLCMNLGYSFEEIYAGALDYCQKILSAVIFLLAVGGVISTWISSGTVPAMIYAGLSFIRPSRFLIVAFLLCAIMSTICGTSWGTLGTVGCALAAVGSSLGIPIGMTAGALISGAYLGDMASPMSGTCRTVSAVCDIDALDYCKAMLPVWSIASVGALLLFGLLGLRFQTDSFDAAEIEHIKGLIVGIFKIGAPTFFPLIFLLVLLTCKVPGLLSVLASSVAASVVAVAYQGRSAVMAVNVFWDGFTSSTGTELMDKLFTRGGVQSMMSTGLLLLFSAGVIGIFHTVGIVEALTDPISAQIQSVWSLSAFTILLVVIGNVIGSKSFSIIMVSSLMKSTYDKLGIDRKQLSMVVAGTAAYMGNAIPWNPDSMYADTLYTVTTAQYLPYTVMCYLIPCILIVFMLRSAKRTRSA